MSMTKEERREYNRKWRAENAEKIKASQAKYCAENAEKVKAYKAEWFAKNAEKEKVRRAKSIAELKDGYVEEMLRRQGFKKEQITPELIELKRITLKTTRLCRQLKN